MEQATGATRALEQPWPSERPQLPILPAKEAKSPGWTDRRRPNPRQRRHIRPTALGRRPQRKRATGGEPAPRTADAQALRPVGRRAGQTRARPRGWTRSGPAGFPALLPARGRGARLPRRRRRMRAAEGGNVGWVDLVAVDGV